jgi:hypothetical protein
MALRERKLLMQRVQELGQTEHDEIFNMLRDMGVDYMQNNNGIFVNLTEVPDDVVHRVGEFVSFCMANKSSLDEYDKSLNECKLGMTKARGGTDADAPPPPSPPPAPLPRDAQQQQQQQQQSAAPSAVDSAAHVAVVQQSNSKYLQARKKFAKRRVPDKKTGRDAWSASIVGCDPAAPAAPLQPEAYLVADTTAAPFVDGM